MIGYALLGATWLNLRTDGPLQARARRQAQGAARAGACRSRRRQPVDAADVGADRASAGSRSPNIFFLWPVPLVTAGLGWLVWRGLDRGRELAPFVGTIGLFVLAYLGLGDLNLPATGAADADGVGHRGGAGQPDLHA